MDRVINWPIDKTHIAAPEIEEDCDTTAQAQLITSGDVEVSLMQALPAISW